MRQYNHLRAMRVSPIEGKLRLLQHVAVLQVFSSAVEDTRWYALLQYMLDMSPRKEPIYIYIYIHAYADCIWPIVLGACSLPLSRAFPFE